MLNVSCARCRLRKIRCDGRVPCSQCLQVGLSAHECTRQLRKERLRQHQKPDAKRIHPADESTGLCVMPSPTQEWSTQEALFYTGEPSKSEPSRSRDVWTNVQLRAKKALGSRESCLSLYRTIFFWRCHTLSHACVSTPELERICKAFEAADAKEGDQITADELGLLCIATSLCLQLFPDKSKRKHPDEAKEREDEVRKRQKRASELQQVALHVFDTRFERKTCLAGLQYMVLLLRSPMSMAKVRRDSIFDAAVRLARELRADQMSSPTLSHGTESLLTDQEAMIRCWWTLILYDWQNAAKTAVYHLHMRHHTSALPTELEVETQLDCADRSLHSNTWHPIRYFCLHLSLAKLVREVVDKLNDVRYGPQATLYHANGQNCVRSLLDSKFQQFFDDLPLGWTLQDAYKSSRSKYTPHTFMWYCDEKSKIERWLLHHHLFRTYLDLSVICSTEEAGLQEVHNYGSSTEIQLSTHILHLHEKVEADCPIIAHMNEFEQSALQAAWFLARNVSIDTSGSSIQQALLRGQVLAIVERFESTHPDRVNQIHTLLGSRSKTTSVPCVPTTDTPIWQGCSGVATEHPILDEADWFNDLEATSQFDSTKPTELQKMIVEGLQHSLSSPAEFVNTDQLMTQFCEADDHDSDSGKRSISSFTLS